MEFVQFHWLYDCPSFKYALQATLHCSGQLLKKHYSSKELSRPILARQLVNLPLDVANHMKINPIYVGPPVIILAEGPDFLALHKPFGIHTHPLCYSDQNTVLNFLVSQGLWKLMEVNRDNYDRGLLYRLDQETSGVLVLAKNDLFFEKMRHGFESEMKRKLYLAVVEGDFKDEGSWEHYLTGVGIKGSKQKVSTEPIKDAHLGRLQVFKLLYSQGKSLLLIDLKSGLRHQIRAQLAAIGHPILGDAAYGGAPGERLFLHAWRYEWDEVIEDNRIELFDRFFDLDRALEMGHDVLRRLK